jgi:AAA15 family ATPase/GTPase
MVLQLQNIEDAKKKLDSTSVGTFLQIDNSFRSFIKSIEIKSFRHIKDLTIEFKHPITIISGANKSGKTSVLLLLACCHEKFMKLDSTSPLPTLREHNWGDVFSFTQHESISTDYQWSIHWRVANKPLSGTGKRIALSKAWSGLAKKSSNTSRENAKIRNREVRLIDLERVLPGRSFSNALYRKSFEVAPVRLRPEIEQAFAYVFELESVEIKEISQHINKSCFLITHSTGSYSTYNSASGEESVIYLLRDLIDSPKDSFILIDEVEAGFHPSIQRRIAEIIQYISWTDKKQFIITTHSPTLLSSFSSRSRKFIDISPMGHQIHEEISHQAARSKMDSIGYPLVRLYCEDELASFLIKKILVKISRDNTHFDRLINIITSGPINEVKMDYIRHKRNFNQFINKIGYSVIFDGDYKNDPVYNTLESSSTDFASFIYPYEKPEKFLVKAYLANDEVAALRAAYAHDDHHTLFEKMVALGLATDRSDARNICYRYFESSAEFALHEQGIKEILLKSVSHFSQLKD